MLLRNWNILDDDYLSSDEVRQHEDAREAQYQQDREQYKLTVGHLWLADKPNEYGDALFATNAKDALVMHLPELQQVIDMLGHEIAHAIKVWHYRPIARLDVDTAKLLLNSDAKDKDEKRYIVQHEDGWVSNDLFDKCYHWQIATPYTLEDAYRIARGHHGMNAAIGDYSEVWILKLGWVMEKLVDTQSKNV